MRPVTSIKSKNTYIYSFTNNKNYSSVAITNKSDIAEKRIEDSHG